MLTRAASEKFGVAPGRLNLADGRISTPDGRSATYAELADAASTLSPKTIELPPLADGVFVGKGIARADIPLKAHGVAEYGIDTRQPGQLYAAIRHSPRLGGILKSASLPAGLPGVRGLVEGSDYFAVVASTYSKAVAGLEKARVVWDDSNALGVSSKDVFAAYRAALDKGVNYKPRWVLDSVGDAASSSGPRVAATYDAPFLAHATMEPMNATALVNAAGVKVWAGHQSGYLAKQNAAGAAGVSMDAVEIFTPYLGGGFGRRADLNYIVKAVEIARYWAVPHQLRPPIEPLLLPTSSSLARSPAHVV